MCDATPENCRKREPLLPQPDAEAASSSSWRLNVSEFRLPQHNTDDNHDRHGAFTFGALLRRTSKRRRHIIVCTLCWTVTITVTVKLVNSGT